MSLTPESIHHRLDGTARAIDALRADADAIAAMIAALVARLRSGGTVYTCGNGGSAAEALHLAEEIIGNYRDRTRGTAPAISLAADPTALTCIANDFGFDEVFARPCRALLSSSDVLVGLSTSGNSENVRRAFEAARERGALTIGLLGRDGGACRTLCDHAIVVPVEDSAHIQEGHLVLVHLICEALEPTDQTER